MTASLSDVIQSAKGKLFKPDPDAALKRELAKEAKYYAQVILKKLEQLDICYRYPKSQKDWSSSGIMKVQFERAVTTQEAIYFDIDTVRLPRGISLSKIDNEDVLSDLSVACRRPVRFKMGIDSGAWLILERAGGHFGVPRSIKFSDILENWPDRSRKPLLVPLGVGENRTLIYKSLAEMPHALVGGATGAGKTTFIHGWICSLITKNGPEDLKLGFIDLKGGVEASFYKGIPHLLEDGIVSGKEAVIPLLEQLYNVVEERLKRLEKSNTQNIAAYNYRHRKNSMARIILFVDELANVMLDRELKKDAQSLLADITARGRAPGVHCVLSTQRPEVAVVPGLVKANLDARAAFRVSDNASSMVILDTTEAAKFDDTSPQGRYIYRRGLERYEMQAPLITANEIKRIVRAVSVEPEPESDDKMLPEDIFRVAIEQLGGSFSRDAMFELLGDQVTQAYLTDLGSEYDSKVVTVDGKRYKMQPSAGRRPRMLIPIENTGGKDG